MSIIITTNSNNEILANDIVCRIKTDPDGSRWVVLPPNDLNRKYVSMKLLEAKGFPYTIDTYKESRTLSPRGEGQPKATTSMKWTEYLTDDEKVQLEELKQKAQKRAEQAQKKQALMAAINEYREKFGELPEGILVEEPDMF